ncbi:COG1361 S-layer family protein [Candidatus Woesearchaeota archaeon]|nr:COG1361 S-layer family protein [Candidatus Woesearchaeota archaeon]
MKKTTILMALIVILTLAMATQTNAASPEIELTIQSYSPSPIEPGDSAELWIKAENIGTETAKKLQVEFLDNYPFKLISENDRITTINELEMGRSYILRYKIQIDPGAIQGSNNIQMKYSYDGHQEYSVTKNLPLLIRTTDTPITLSYVKLNDETMHPGEKNTLKIGIKNLAKSSTVRDLSVELILTPVYGSTGILADIPFTPLNSGSKKTLDKIRAGQTAEFEFQIATYPDAESKLYKVPVQIKYRDEIGTQYNDTILIGLEVNSKPELMITLEDSQINTQNPKGEITIAVTNRGISDLKLMTLTLEESQDYQIISPTNQIYLGNVDSDDFETARFEIKTQGSGTIKLPIQIEYKDSLNKDFKENYEIEYNILEPNGEQNNTGTIIIVVIILAIIGIIIYKKRKKKRK